ncbi:MAG: hypothetical protein ABMA13_01945 [Chthoniobacteraceae bacterium]
MNDQPSPAPESAPDYQFPLRFYAQLTHPLRIWIIRQLAQGVELSPKHVAKARGRKYRAVNLHCQSLHEAGVVSWRPGKDRRWDVYFIPEGIRREPGWLDYGFCRFRIQ